MIQYIYLGKWHFTSCIRCIKTHQKRGFLFNINTVDFKATLTPRFWWQSGIKIGVRMYYFANANRVLKTLLAKTISQLELMPGNETKLALGMVYHDRFIG